MKAKSIKGVSAEEIAKKLKLCMADAFKPTLAVVFISIKQDRQEICELLDQEGIAIFGSTTAGEIIDGEIGQGSVAILLLDIGRTLFKILFAEAVGITTREIARDIGQSGVNTFSNPAFIVACGGLFTDGEMIIKGLEDAAGPGVAMFGGMAGDDLTATGTFVFNNKKVTDNGLIALVVDKDKIKITGLATHGWKPVGTVHAITKSEGNIVYAIDGEPALDILIRYMGLSYDTAIAQKMEYNLGDYYPVQLLKDNAPSIMREMRAINTGDRSIMFSASVPQGSKFRFSLPPDWDIIDRISADCHNVKKEQQTEADAVIVFSCATRPLTFGPMINKEVEEINKVWERPMVGFFTYGEIGKSLTGQNELHNNTCMVVVLKEK